ncbi:MAG: Glu-tRNA(Gln) amidotransferase subunit GatE [Candidatus Bathyarchaeota archaeon]|nr:MAG: Glu-tRNA(Gln) amidotransferase subunit GatE [Candidatus Bathyarchaeota archaeon]
MVAADYEKLGLKVGLEVHQQLNTKTKLFCDCRTELFKERPEITFLRRLRPTQSELGQIDPVALFEFQKGVKILYDGNKETSCLVEMDEEPPHDLNREALETALIISLMLGANPLDEIHVMRKTVIDGSNTTGFQRTCCVAFNGGIDIKEKVVPIQHIGLEEDAARKMGAEGDTLRYRIDRLCIPLVEVATSPVIYTPKEAEEVALAIGRILRATGRVKRGLGTIRQDLNISITDGALVEIKGVQELELVSLVVENEVQRQLNLLKIKEELAKRGAKKDEIKDEFVDVTSVFRKTKCKIIHSAVEEGKHVLAVRLPRFGGLLKKELMPNVRLGTEMADRAGHWGRVGGIFHTDELPAYGITVEEIKTLMQTMNAKQDDTVVLAADIFENVVDALKAVNGRAMEALKGIPNETRAAKPDGSTRYSRPRPGATRMYPETDVPPTEIPRPYVERLNKYLPELPEQKMQRFIRDYGLNEKLSKQVLNSEFTQLFEETIERSNISPTIVAVTLTETLKALNRESVEVKNVSDKQFLELFHLVGLGHVVKEAIPDIIAWLSRHKNVKTIEAIEALSLSMLSQKELENIVDSLIEENRKLLLENEKRAFGVIMGLTMKKVRGKAEAGVVSEIVNRRLTLFKKKS